MNKLKQRVNLFFLKLIVNLLFSCFIVVCLSHTYLIAQVVPFKSVSIDEGLSQSVAQALVQDKYGYLWIGTEYGLNRFNGKRIDSFYESDGLPSNAITALTVDNAGVLWIGTDKGVALWLNDTFTIFEGTDSLLKSPVNAIKHDKNGTIWLATEGDGLWSYNGLVFERWNIDNGLSSDSVRDVLPNVNGNLWIATRNGLNIFDGQSFNVFYEKDGLADNKVRSLLRTADNSVWVGTRNGISIFSIENEIKLIKNSLSSRVTKVKKLFQDRLNTVWIASENGLYRWKKGEVEDFNQKKGIENNYFFDVLEDREGLIWLASFGNGVIQYQGDQYLNWTIEDGLPNNVVSSIYQERNGIVWVGTFGGGLAKLHKNHSIEVFKQSNSSLSDDRIYHINPMRDGSIWLATRQGISKIAKNGILQKVVNIEDDRYRHILEAGKDDIWLATEDNGINHLKNGINTKITTENGLVSNSTRVLFKRSDGAIFVGTTNGLSVIKDGRIKNYTLANGLMNQVILDMTETSDGSIWFAHFLGISKISMTGEITNVPLSYRGEPIAGYLIREFNSYLWIGTNKGLVRYDYTSPSAHLKFYTSSMGLVNDELNKGAIYIDSKGYFWLGTVRGMTRFDPLLSTEKITSIPLYFEEVEAKGKKLDAYHNLELDYDDNHFKISFSPITMQDPNTIEYRYRLYPADPTWQTTHLTTIRYAGLPDDEYEFMIKSISNDGIESERIRLPIVVNPPFWKSSWFIFLVISVIGIVILLVLNNIRFSKQVEFERMRVRIASDLHDDVGASLTEMALQADYLQSFSLEEEVKESMQQIGEMSRNIVTTMDDIVWSIDARNDTLGDLMDRIQDYAIKILSRTSMEPIFHFEGLDQSKTLHADTRQNIYLICKEAINNAVKYSNGSQLEVKFQKKENQYNLAILDNGSGNGELVKKTGHGLKNMKTRSEKLQARFDILNSNGYQVRVSGIQL